MKKLEIDWSSIVTNAISSLVAAVFLAAAIFLWKNTEANKSKIDANFKASSSNLNSVKKELILRIAELEVQVDYQNKIMEELIKIRTLNSEVYLPETLERDTIPELIEGYKKTKDLEIETNKNELYRMIDIEQRPIQELY